MNKLLKHLNNDINVVTFCLILILILSVIFYNLYIHSNHNTNGTTLSYKDTFWNIFGFLPDIIVTVSEDNPEDIPESIEKISKKTINRLPIKRKEVYNIDSNDFTYLEAPLVCQSFNGKLATYDQLLSAHKDGANWCNYGWSANQMALYPIQQDVWDKIQEGPEDSRNICGKPGINGGYFPNKELKFGVNCYGYKPKPDPSKIVYNKTKHTDNIPNVRRTDLLNKFIKMENDGKLNVRPFNTNSWSRYSFRKSSYIINPEYSPDINSNQNNEVAFELTDTEKDPNTYELSNTIKSNTIKSNTIKDNSINIEKELSIDDPKSIDVL